ncbi:hypothetical protein MASR2M48_08450 [Spirochaetota bacterium]
MSSTSNAVKLPVGMLVADLFEDLEFWSLAMRVREAGFKVLVIGTKAGETYKQVRRSYRY